MPCMRPLREPPTWGLLLEGLGSWDKNGVGGTIMMSFITMMRCSRYRRLWFTINANHLLWPLDMTFK